MINTIEINALDPLFFRDALPFEMGNENNGGIQFPPNPTVLRGMLRSMNVYQNERFDNSHDSTKDIEITSIQLLNNSTPIFPLPLDIMAFKKDKNKTTNLILEHKGLNSLPFDYELRPKELDKAEDLAGHFLTITAFRQYLDTGRAVFTTQGNLINISDFTTSETKFGIGRSRETQTTLEGKLFRIPLIRLSKNENQQIKMKISFSQKDQIIDNGFTRLGGEGKMSYFKKVEQEQIYQPNFEGNRFKLYLSTPAIFEQGELPNIETLSNKAGVKIKILTCAVGKQQYIGGFDMVQKTPKPMYRAVPAGSVYYCEIENATDMPKIIQQLNGQSITDFLKEDGFGIVYIAKL
jgi:CRISPR-associated protein Cmr3